MFADLYVRGTTDFLLKLLYSAPISENNATDF